MNPLEDLARVLAATLEADVRRQLVGMLAAQGMSTRAIGSMLGVHHDTVATDLRAGVGNPTPEPERIDPVTGEVESLDEYRGRTAPAPDTRPTRPNTEETDQ